jgi:tetratricopeptide (TPR) repeat protein
VVIKQKRSLISARETAPDEKFTLSREIAGIYKEKLNNPQKAIAAQLEALNLRPGERELLHDLLELFSETKQWKKAMEILMKLAELDSGSGKARFLIAAGNIANYELHSPTKCDRPTRASMRFGRPKASSGSTRS